VPVEGCAFDSRIARRLTELRYLLERGLAADDADLQPYPGIQSNADLLRHLSATEMREDVVFAHGDLGDSNLFLDDAGDLYFIDLGRGGLADRWLDIAFAHRNLVEELSSEAAETLLKKLAIPDQPARRRYFEMLDELF
jgi:kanamycin kinase